MSDQTTVSGQTEKPQASKVFRAIFGFLGLIIREVFAVVFGVLEKIVGFIDAWLVDSKRALYGTSAARILLALTGIGLLLTNFRTRFYFMGSGSAWNGEGVEPLSDFPKIWIFSIFRTIAFNDVLFTLGYLGLFALAIVVLVGYRTKFFLPLFFIGWVSFIETNDSLGDQGDNMYRIAILALLFADTSARWSFDARRRSIEPKEGNWLVRKLRGERMLPEWLTNTMHNLALVATACHVCFVYASGALFKAGGDPWKHGYAIYNPLQTVRFGPWPELSDLVTYWAPAVAITCWASIILQMIFPMALLNRFTRIIVLFGITSFHLGIAILMGLPWFSLAMVAIDTIFIRDVTWKAVESRVKVLAHKAYHKPVPEPVVEEKEQPYLTPTPVAVD